MSRRNRNRKNSSELINLDLSLAANVASEIVAVEDRGGRTKRLLVIGAGAAISLLLVLGVFAHNGWLPRTDALSGQKTGWFGKALPQNAASVWNPMTPPPTTSLRKEYIYAGSRLLAVEDANANAVPPADLAVWRPGNGTWYVSPSSGSNWGAGWGGSGDKPAPGDYS